MITQDAVKTAKRIEESLGVEALQARLAEYPEKIRIAQDTLKQWRQAVDAAKAELETAEALLVAEIAMDMDSRSGKAKFSNAELRKSELVRRQAADPLYAAAKQELQQAQNMADTAQFSLDCAYNEFSAVKSIARLVEQRLRILAG